MIARSTLRTHRRASIFLTLFAGIAGGAVLTAVAASSRTSTTYDRFLAMSEPAAAVVTACPPGLDEEDLERTGTAACYGDAHTAEVRDVVAALPGVRGAARGALAIVAAADPETPSGWSPTLALIEIDAVDGVVLGRPIVVEGRLADDARADEVVINEVLADVYGYEVGDEVTLRPFTMAQLDDIAEPDEVPQGATAVVTVVGIIRLADDLQPSRPTVDLPRSESGDSHFYVTPAWWDAYGPDVAAYVVGTLVTLDEATTPEAFDRAAIAALSDRLAFTDQVLIESAPIRQVIDLQSNAVLVVGLVLALAALVFVGQAITRQVRRELAHRDTLHALGLTRLDLAGAAVMRFGGVAVASAALAALLSIALSPLTPVGLGRRAEVDPGLDVAPLVLLVGVPAIALAVLALAWAAAASASRASRRRARRQLGPGASRAPVSVAAGMLLARGRGTSAAIACGAFAVVCVSAAGALLNDMHRLEADPTRFGVTWDYAVGNYSDVESWEDGVRTAAATPGVVATGGEYSSQLDFAGHATPVVAFDPRTDASIGPVVLEGRAPTRDDEVALGAVTMRDLGVGIGDEVHNVGNSDLSLHVVGRVVVNDNGTENVNPGRAALLTAATFDALTGFDVDNAPQAVLVRIDPALPERPILEALQESFGRFIVPPTAHADIRNLRLLAPALVSAATAMVLLAVAALAHALITTVRGRRRDLATLRALGFTRGQVSAAVGWDATAVATLAAVVGIPLGLLAARVTWQSLEHRLGITSPATMPPLPLLAATAASALLAANLVTIVPARRAARSRPAEVLRAE